MLFLIAIFTPFQGTITLVAIGIVLDYVLRILGIMIFKTIEILGRKRERMRKCSVPVGARGTESPGEEKDGNHSEGDEDMRGYERSRTMDSSVTAINEEAPLGAIRQCNDAVTKQYRIPGQQ